MPQVRSGGHHYSHALLDAVERLGENRAPDSGTCLKNPISEFGFTDTLLNPCDPVVCADIGLATCSARPNELGVLSGITRIYINSEVIVIDYI